MKNKIHGRKFRYNGMMILPLLALFVFLDGCALFNKGAKKEDAEKAAAESAFDSDQDKMSDYVASVGRQNPKEKRVVPKGETFLLSSKAKEIYANTER